MNKTQRGDRKASRRKASRRKASRCGGKKTHHRNRKGGQHDDLIPDDVINNMTRGGLVLR